MQLAFLAADNPPSQSIRAALSAFYGEIAAEKADTIVAIGGDGFMLEVLHQLIGHDRSIYGLRSGQSLGFLCNDSMGVLEKPESLAGRISRAQPVHLPLLRMRAETLLGQPFEAMAINEVSLLRETRQTAKLRLSIDGQIRLAEIVCDGILAATPAGSTAYNLSAHGPILPLSANVLAITAISSFRPRRWRGAVVPQASQISIEVMEAEKRPVLAVADFTEVRDVRRVDIEVAQGHRLPLLFDPEHSLDERILSEQFA